ncbi:hisI [Symbiodinium sp. CCMP2456]|nr:hisI [Symbiodinium sp. CCMP2456]
MASHHELEEGKILNLDWEKLKKVSLCESPVIPVAVQSADSKEVLIVAFANEQALMETLHRRVCVLWSTSRNQLWIKGSTSGDVLDLVEVRVNCEQNSLLYLVRPRTTGACHTKGPDGVSRPSCYYRRIAGSGLCVPCHCAQFRQLRRIQSSCPLA